MPIAANLANIIGRLANIMFGRQDTAWYKVVGQATTDTAKVIGRATAESIRVSLRAGQVIKSALHPKASLASLSPIQDMQKLLFPRTLALPSFPSPWRTLLRGQDIGDNDGADHMEPSDIDEEEDSEVEVEGEEDEQNEELRQDEESYEDGAEEQGAPEDYFEIDPEIEDEDDDLDYNESDLSEEAELEENESGGYRDIASEVLLHEVFEDMSAMLDEDGESGQEDDELLSDNLIAGDELFDEATDNQGDLYDFITEDAPIVQFDAAVLVGASEIFDDDISLNDDIMGAGLANNFAGEGL